MAVTPAAPSLARSRGASSRRQDDRSGGRRLARRTFTRASSSRRPAPSIRTAAAFSFTSAASRSVSAASKVHGSARAPALALRPWLDGGGLPGLARSPRGLSPRWRAPWRRPRGRSPASLRRPSSPGVSQPDSAFVRVLGMAIPPHSSSAITGTPSAWRGAGGHDAGRLLPRSRRRSAECTLLVADIAGGHERRPGHHRPAATRGETLTGARRWARRLRTWSVTSSSSPREPHAQPQQRAADDGPSAKPTTRATQIPRCRSSSPHRSLVRKPTRAGGSS